MIIDGIIYFITSIISFFPDSPIEAILPNIQGVNVLHYVNWFIPFSDFRNIGLVWVGCVGAYYAFTKSKEIKNFFTDFFKI